jgi:hypothetical protein
MGKFTVDSYAYVPSGTPYIMQRVKGKKKPYGAVAGGNGTFVMPGSPPQINLRLNPGGILNIYPLVKRETSQLRVTKQYAEMVCETLKGKEFDSIEDLNEAIIRNL